MTSLGRNWWALALRGSLAMLFGVVVLVAPEVTLRTLSSLFGAYALGDGLCAAISGVRAASRDERWQSFLLEGLVGLGAGLVALLVPASSIAAFMLFFGAYAVVTGVYEVISAVRLRHEIEGEWLLAAAGAASIVFGLLFVASPVGDGAVLLYGMGVYALVFGIVLLMLSVRLRALHRAGPPIAAPA
jgi:uncharacterized membrane protein HdeD (DUF308 family)